MLCCDRPRSARSLAGRDPKLRLDQVDVGDLLRDGVLDLDAGVHLQEDMSAGRVDEELDRAGVGVADLPGERDGVGADPVPETGIEMGRRRDLDDLLVPALHRTVTFEEVDHLARAVREHLHLDVTGAGHRLGEEDRRVAEGRLGLAHRRLDGLGQVGRFGDAAQPATTAAGHRLHEERVADLSGGGDERRHVRGRGG